MKKCGYLWFLLSLGIVIQGYAQTDILASRVKRHCLKRFPRCDQYLLRSGLRVTCDLSKQIIAESLIYCSGPE
jgi:hypothetical protein